MHLLTERLIPTMLKTLSSASGVFVDRGHSVFSIGKTPDKVQEVEHR